MHTALVAKLMKDRSTWEMVHVPANPAAEPGQERLTVAAMRHPALMGA
jgi:hypothetical protein